jgi:hypothetical protein
MKARLRLWIGREHYRMDFRLKKLKRGHGGLNMDLCPGRYHGHPMPEDAIQIAEDSFWFLESGIKSHSAQYARPYAHYGVTDIPRTEWFAILGEWKELQRLLLTAKTPLDLPVLRKGPRYARKAFIRDFRRNCAGLAKMIGMLEEWFRAKLESNDQIFIGGI